MEYIKKLINRKNIKYIMSVFIVYAIFMESLAVYAVYSLFSLGKAATPSMSSGLFFTILMSVILTPLIYIIAYLVSLFLINKNKTAGYLISGIVSILIFFNSIDQLTKNHIQYTVSMIPHTLFWIVLIISSFWARIKLTKD